MITAIYNVASEKGSGQITFTVDVEDSAAETVSTQIDGTKFDTTVTQSNTGSSSHSIAHTKAGLRTIGLKAESSDVRSAPVLLDL